MKKAKLIAMILCFAMLLSLAACGAAEEQETIPVATPTEAPQPTEALEEVKETYPQEAPASVDFEDGNMGFVSLWDGLPNADASKLELVDYRGGKALKVTNGSGKVPYVAIDASSLLGDKLEQVGSVEMTVGIENPDGDFYACSGNLILWHENKLSGTKYGWSVYMEDKNPNTASFKLKNEYFSADISPIFILTLETDNGADAGMANANLYIDNIRFFDVSGNLLEADTTAAFVQPNGFVKEKDLSNLVELKKDGEVYLDGMAGMTGSGWGQNGLSMTEEFRAAMVPGAVIEIEFTSANNDMWIVFPDDGKWSRIECQTAAMNDSANIVQITFEQIAAVCGEDPAAWGDRIQCESSGDWEVYTMRVSQKAE